MHVHTHQHKQRNTRTLAKKSKTVATDQNSQLAGDISDMKSLTPDVIMQLQAIHGNQYVSRLVQRMKEDTPSTQLNPNTQPNTIQRDGDEPGMVKKGVTEGVTLGDVTGAIVQAYEAYNGDDSANVIVKAIGELSGNIADTTGGIGDTGEGASSGGVGGWSKFTGGITNLVTKGTELVSQTAGYVKSGLDYVGLGGGNVTAATDWIGGWAKSASDVVSPYAWYTDIAVGSTKAMSGIADGWNLGYVLQDLSNLAGSSSNAEVQKAAKLMFDIAWWKRLEGYGQGIVGAIEGGGAAYLGPLSKGITTVMTKSYESGWTTYFLRAMASSVTSSVLSNAQIGEQAEANINALNTTIRPMVEQCKLDDLVALCEAADALEMSDFIKKIWQEFNNPPSGKEKGYRQRKNPFKTRMQSAGLGQHLA